MVSFYLVNSQPERTFPSPVQTISTFRRGQLLAGPTTWRPHYIKQLPKINQPFLKSIFVCIDQNSLNIHQIKENQQTQKPKAKSQGQKNTLTRQARKRGGGFWIFC